jgi:hypothetical protein
MNWLLIALFIFLSLFVFRNKLKNTILLYVTLVILFIVYQYFYINMELTDSREISLIWLKILPLIILWTISIIITFFIDLFNKRKFLLSEKKYLYINNIIYILLLITFIFIIKIIVLK